MKPFKNIRPRLGIYKLRRILILMCTSFCVIIGNILFSDVAFGGLLDGDNIYVEYEPAKSSLPHGRTSGDVVARLTGADIDSITVTSNGGLEHIFTQTGSFTFRYKNNNSINIITQSIEAKVDWIDKEPPTCGVVYSTKGEDYFGGCSHEQYDECIDGNRWNAIYTRLVNAFGRKTACIQQCSNNNIVEFAGQLTNEDVVATLTGCSEEIIVTNNGGSSVYTFTENGNFTFEFQDLAGNPGNLYSKVNGIDRILPECDVIYSQNTLTSGNVVARLTGCNKALKNGTVTSYEFTGNGVYRFLLEDKEGNTGEAKAKVNWIDKESPVCIVEYNPSSNTTGDVLTILTGCSEKITESETMFLFMDNGSYTFRYQDLVGNTGVTQANVNWILPDEALTGITHTINDNIITLSWEIIDGYGGDVDFYLWYEDNKEYSLLGTTGLESRNFSFEAQQEGGHMIKIAPRNGGNIKYYSISYENTHPTITPMCEIEYPDPNKQPTNQDVIIKLTNCNEKVYVTNTDGGNIFHTFNDNGTFTFTFSDDYGNTGTTTAVVDWIDKIPPQCLVSYSDENITREPVTARIDNCSEEIHFSDGYGDSYTFNQNGRHIFYFLDNVGNIGTTEANVSWITGDNEGQVSYAITGINHMENDGDIILTWDVLNGKYINILRSYNYEEYILLDEDINVNTQNYSFRSLGTGHYSIKFVPQNNLLESIYSFDIVETDNEPYEGLSCQIMYSTYSVTSGDVIATLTGCNRAIIIDSPTHIFTGNGTYIFNFEDINGNPGEGIASVDWIDKEAPQCSVSYSTTQTTNGDVIATISCNDQNTIIKNNNGQPTYLFTGNDEFIFEVSDLVGNTTSVTAQVFWIEHTISCNIVYSTLEPTSGDVIAELTGCDREIIIDNAIHTFSENGTYIFNFEDGNGNSGQKTASVNWIDKEAPQCSISYSTTQTTSGNVSATISCDDTTTIIKNNNGKSSYIFTGNGSFVFEVSDLVGNTASVTANVSRIKTEISCNIVYSTLSTTNHDVTAELTGCNKEIIISSPIHTFTENGIYIFNFEDRDGNHGQKIAEVDWIDKTPPVCIISYSTLQTTNQNVNATITCNDPNAIIKNNNSQSVYTFTGNGSFTFEVVDLAGNTVSIPVQVSWIDKDSPTCDVSYSTRQQTSGEVIATLTNCSEQIFTIPGYNLYYKFQSNGSHTIIFRDNVGNIGSTRAEVNRIVIDNGTNNNQETGSAHEEGDTYHGYPITGLNHSFYNDNVIITWDSLTSGYMDIFMLHNNSYIKIDTIHTNSEFYTLETIMDYSIKFVPLDVNQQEVYYTITAPHTHSNPNPGDPNPENPNPDISGSDEPNPENPNPSNPTVPVYDEIPTCNVSYSTVQETDDDVIATLSACSEEVTPLVGYSFSHVFTDNGNYIFYFVDNNGNIGTTQANVTWIKHINISNETGFAMTGIRHFISGNKINLTWTKLSNGITDVYLWDFSNNRFEKLGSTNISNEEFVVDIVKTGEYLFKLVPENNYHPVTYFVYIDNYVGETKVPVCNIVFNYENNNVVASLTGCNKNVSVINNSGDIRHTFGNHENLFVFKFEDDEGYIGRATAHMWYSEKFDNYYDSSLLGKYAMNDYLVIHGINPSNKSITITGSNILLDNGGILESNVTCVLSSGNTLTINIDGLGTNVVNDIIVPGNYAGYISYALPKSFYANNMALNFDLQIKNDPNGSCIIDDISIVSKPNTVVSTKKTGAKTGTDYNSQEIEISGLPENTAIPVFVNIDYSDNVVQNYGKCVSNNGSSLDYCIGKYISDLVLYKNGVIVTGGETVGQNGDIFKIKIKSSIYENSTITANLMFGHTRKSIISQFTVTTTGNQTHGSAEFEYDYSKFDPSYEDEWNKAYQYSYFYGITTKSPIKQANMEGNLTRIAMAKMMSNYAINVLGLQLNDYKQCSFTDVTPSENIAYDGGVINACKLGIMGINMPNDEFRPYDIVTRAEFATALSRLLYNTKDGKDIYYSTHIAKLKSEKIIKDTNPNLIEKKGYVMLMLMRSKQ